MDRDSQSFAAHDRAVCRYIAARTEPDVVEDVAADTFMVAWRRRDELPSQPRPWLLGTAARCLANHRRTARRTARVGERLADEPAPVSRSVEDALVRVERGRALFAARGRRRLRSRRPVGAGDAVAHHLDSRDRCPGAVGATPDVIAQAASAYRSSVGEGITFSGELRYGDDSGPGTVVRVEGSQQGPVAALAVPGEIFGGLEERTSLGHRVALFQVALPELRELLERAGAGEDDSVRVAGETIVAGRTVYELQMDLADGGSWTLYVDRENYRPVRFEQLDPSGNWATLDFVRFERMTGGD